MQGFWDMVYYEVSGLYKMFEELADMESNGWQAQPPSPKKKKLQASPCGLTKQLFSSWSGPTETSREREEQG